MLNPNAKPYQCQKKMMIHIMSPSAYYYHKEVLPVLPPPPQLIQPSFYLKPSLLPIPPPLQQFHAFYPKPSLPPPPQLSDPFYAKPSLYYPPLPSFPPPPPPPLQHEHQQLLLPHEYQQPPHQHENQQPKFFPHEHQQPPLKMSPKTQEYHRTMHTINRSKKKGRIMTKPKNTPSFANSSTTRRRRSSLPLPHFAPGTRFIPRGPRQYGVKRIEVNHGSCTANNNKYSSYSEHSIDGPTGTGVYLIHPISKKPAANKKTTARTTSTSSTSVMMRNIPNGLSREMLIRIVDKHCIDENNKARRMFDHDEHDQDNSSTPESRTLSEYDFLYLPVDFKSKVNLGYAFLNFTTSVAAMRFYKAFDNYSWESATIKSPKICMICPARIQGKDGLVDRFKHSYFRCESDEFLPVSFSPPRNGYTSRPLPSVIGKRPKISCKKMINRTSH